MAGRKTDVHRKSELTADIARTRAALAGGVARLRRRLDVASSFTTSVRRHRTAWLAGAGLAGWLLSRLPPRRKVVKVFVDKHRGLPLGKTAATGGLLLTLGRAAFVLLRPVLAELFKRKVASWSMRR
jgi:hypothetical protein